MRINNAGLRALGLAVALASSTVAAPTLAAAPAVASSGEHQKLAEEMAGLMFDMLDFRALMAEAMAGSDFRSLGETRPEWPRMLETAIVEEIEQDMPKLKHLAAAQFAGHFTVDELQTGLQVFKDPAVVEAFKIGAAGGKPSSDLQPSQETIKLVETPAGRRFLAKLEDIEKVMKPLETDFTAEVFPGAMRRFADKAEAAEARRAR